MTNRKIKINEDPNGKQLKMIAAASSAALHTEYPKNCPTDAKINKLTNDETAPWLGFSAKSLPGEDFYVHVMNSQNYGHTKETAT